MLKFFTNRELSRILDINIAKLKRWSREFLPPDPLGGLQSGFARQYNPHEAFTLYIGGCLVGELKFTIAEAKQILIDLHDWFVAHGLYTQFGAKKTSKNPQNQSAKRFQIFIMRSHPLHKAGFGFFYVVRSILSLDAADHEGLTVTEARYHDAIIDPHHNYVASHDCISGRMVDINAFRDNFFSKFD